MKAGEEFFLDIITKNIQFKIPIYQRLYDWRTEHCQTLIEDIYQLLQNPEIPSHFMGSIVYIDENDQTRVNPTKELLLIDGQQRITTFTLIFLILEELAKNQGNDMLAEEIRESCLINKHSKLENKGKLILTKRDNDILQMLLTGKDVTRIDSNLVTNYNFIKEKIQEMNESYSLEAIHEILYKIMVVDVGLLKGQDNPQQIFESLNATGKALTEADLIRNFILMNLESEKQDYIYTHYWYPMETLLGDELKVFLENFVYMKKGISTNIKDLYKEFKLLFYKSYNNGDEDVEKFASELKKYAEYYANTEFEEEKNEKIKSALRDLNELNHTTYIPFLLNVYNEYNEGNIDVNDLCEIIRVIESFLFRRSICDIPTNSLNPIFRTMWKNITKSKQSGLNLKDNFIKQLKSGERNKRWPDDNEFRENLIYNNLYGKKFGKILLEELEKFSSKESQNRSFDDFSIEHILPQTAGDPEKLSDEWKEMLGQDYVEIRDKWLNKLGNLTLTCYNSGLSDKSFEYKKHMKDGYENSPLKLNLQVAKYETWDEDSIVDRGNKLAELALNRWKYDSRDFGAITQVTEGKEIPLVEFEDTSKTRKIPTSDKRGNYNRGDLEELLESYFADNRKTPQRIKNILLPLCLKHSVVTRDMMKKELVRNENEDVEDEGRAGLILTTISGELGRVNRDYLRQIICYDKPNPWEKENYRIADDENYYKELVQKLVANQ